jgi:hypothetical protein
MKKLVFTLFLFFSLSTMIAIGNPFMDDFSRADNKKLGNDWTTQTDGTIKVEIVNQEALISGKQATDWVRAGLSRVIEDETKVYFDFLANENFNVHIRIDDTGTGAYMDIYAAPGGSFSQASSPDGAWPGWTEIPSSTMLAGQYNTFGVEKEEANFILYLNDKKLISIKNVKLLNITKVLFASDAAANTVGSLHIDNVIIGDPTVKPKAVESPGKLSILWGKLKKI